MAACTGCDASCTGCTSCSGCTSCTGCSGCTSCTGTCKGKCQGCQGCVGSCTGTCNVGCFGSCVGDCNKYCFDTCKDDCFTECKTSCFQTCKNKCKGYCAKEGGFCQTYCETEQTFSKNTDYPNPPDSPGTFAWSNTMSSGQTIIISASDWNNLIDYISKASKYCDITSPSQSNVQSGFIDPITADRYNDLANAVDVSNVIQNETILRPELFAALSSGYNQLQMEEELPSGKWDGGQDDCCQSGQVCMATGELLLPHQEQFFECIDEIIDTTCFNGQSPGPSGP